MPAKPFKPTFYSSSISTLNLHFLEYRAFVCSPVMPLLPLNPSSVSFLARARYRIHYPRRHVSTKSTDPLRILFCGSDSFSIASLRALFQEQRSNPGLIESIDVVCKEPKRVGRGLKVFRAGNNAWEIIGMVDMKLTLSSSSVSSRKRHELTLA